MSTNHYKQEGVTPFIIVINNVVSAIFAIRNFTTITVFAIIFSDLAKHRR